MSDVVDYIKYYEDVVPNTVCHEILSCTETVYVPSTYSNNDGVVVSTDRVSMDEFWVKKDSVLYPVIHKCFSTVIEKYSDAFPRFSVKNTTDFRF